METEAEGYKRGGMEYERCWDKVKKKKEQQLKAKEKWLGSKKGSRHEETDREGRGDRRLTEDREDVRIRGERIKRNNWKI